MLAVSITACALGCTTFGLMVVQWAYLPDEVKGLQRSLTPVSSTSVAVTGIAFFLALHY